MAVVEKRVSRSGEITYRVKIRLKGLPPQTASFSRKRKAEQWAQETEMAMRDGRYFKTLEAKQHTFGDLVDRYIAIVLPTKPKSAKKQQAQLLWWKEKLGYYTLADISPALIAACRDELLNGITCRGTKRGPATTVRYLAVISHAFSVAIREWMWVESNPVTKVTKPTEPRGRVRYLTDKERHSLLVACQNSSNPNLYPAVVLALSTALRRGEILNLRWSDIDFDRDRITVYETKNNEIKVAPLVGFAKTVLTEHFNKRSLCAAHVFPRVKEAYRGTQPQPVCIRNAWDRAVKDAGLTDLRFHDLRHEALSQLAMGGASLRELAEVANHKSLSMVARYSHLSEQHTKALVQKMNEKMFEKMEQGISVV